MKQRGGFGQVEAVGHCDQAIARNLGLFEVAAVFGSVGHHPPSGPGGIDVRAERVGSSGYSGTRHVRGAGREPVASETSPDLGVEEQHRRKRDIDDDRTGRGRRRCKVAGCENFGAAEGDRLHCPHDDLR